MDLKISITAKGKIFEGKAPEIIQEKLTAAMYEATQFLENKVKDRIPTEIDGIKKGRFQGNLRQSVHGEVIQKGTPVVKGVVATQSKYGEVVEKGRRPGQAMPPKGALVKWMQTKFQLDEAMAKKKEFGLRLSIKEKGFEGVHMFEKALDENLTKVQDIFDKAGFNIARELEKE